MHDEYKNADSSSRNSKSSKIVPILSIPDPIEVFKIDSLYRPPSVPVLGRRVSSESLHKFNEEKQSHYPSHVAFKKYRRNSIPDRLDKRPSAGNKRHDSKLKFIQKNSDIKPHLMKSSKLIKIKSSKLLLKKSNLSTPHLKKLKNPGPRACLVTPEIPSSTPDRLRISNNIPKPKLIEKKDEEQKKVCRERKEIISKYNGEIIKLSKAKPPYKVSKSALSVREEMKKHFKEIKNEKLLMPKNDETPSKQRVKKKVIEKSSNHSTIAKVKHLKEERKQSVSKIKSHKKKSKEREDKKFKIEIKFKNQFKNIESLLKKSSDVKKTKKKSKSKNLRHNKQEEWLDLSFFKQAKTTDNNSLKDNSKFFEISAADKYEETKLIAKESFEKFHSEKVDVNFPILSKIGSNLPPAGVSGSSNEEEEVQLIKKEGLKERFRLIQSKLKKKTDQTQKTRAAVKIQAWVRGHLVRKSLKNKISSPIINQKLEQSNSLIYKLHNGESFTEDFDEVKQIFGEFQVPRGIHEDMNSIVQELERDKENISKYTQNSFSDKLDESKNNTSQISAGKALLNSEIDKILRSEQENYQKLTQDQKEVLALDSLKQRKLSLEELRNKDLQKIKELTPKSGAESEIFQLFQDIINRRYEKINNMFDENIKAVQEALAQSIIMSEEPSLVFDVNSFQKLLNEDPSSFGSILQKKQIISTHSSPEPGDSKPKFLNTPKSLSGIEQESEPLQPKNPRIFQSNYIENSCPNNSKVSPLGSSIIWIDEVCMPNNIDFTDLIIDAAISEIYEILFDELLGKYWTITAEDLSVLSEELMMAILFHEIRSKVDEMRKEYDEDGISDVLSMIFQRTADELLGAMNSPIECDPLSVLSILQETEVGAGFEIENKIPILNYDAFSDIIECESSSITAFNKMIFDCVNDSLDKLITKIEYPWSEQRNPRKIYESVLKIQDFVEGRIFNFNFVKAGKISDENSASIENREKGVLKILKYEINENEKDWTNYEFEETQAKLDLADMVLEKEIEDIIEIIIKK